MTDTKAPLIFLAPMAGVSDSAFCTLCRRRGADMLVSEMISAKAIWFKDKKTAALAAFSDEERPKLLQIFGSDPVIMAFAAKKLEEDFRPDGIDINMGCPVPKIVNSGDGSALMKNPALIYEITSRVADAVKIPVSVKLRKGFDSDNAVLCALEAQRAGASTITVHGKTRRQMYAPPVDLDIIRDVKRALKIPVVGNGDIKSAADAKKMLEYTGCDHIMIGRAALGAPFIFEEIRAGLEGKSFTPPSFEETAQIMREHFSLVLASKGEYAIPEFRKHLLWYIKGFPGAAALRDAASGVTSSAEIADLTERIARIKPLGNY